MSQDFNILSTSNVIREDVARHNTNYATLRSQFSGTTFPSNPTVGQPCFRTDLGQVVAGGGVTGRWFVYSGNANAGNNGWVNVQDMGELEDEIINARGSKLTLDQRLDIALNEDGTLKQNAVATISEWQSLGVTFTYVDTTTFTTDGNTTDIYLAGRKIKVNLNSSVFYARVVSSTYTTETTVVIDTASLDATLLSVDYHIVSPQNDDDIQNASEVSYDNTTSGLTATDVKGAIDETVTLSRGFKNLIINGDKRVNQREYADEVLADGTYGYDRWKGANSDADIEQVIEQQNIKSGTYTISWVGGGTATVGGTSGLSSGDSITLTVTSDISVIVPKAATDIQLEPGNVATPFEHRPYGLELSLCQRYYETGYGSIWQGQQASHRSNSYVSFNVRKRTTPTISLTMLENNGYASPTAEWINQHGFSYAAISNTTTADGRVTSTFIADAEL